MIAVSALTSVVLLWKFNLVLTLILILLAVAMLIMNKSKQEIKTFLVCALLGAMAEVVAITFGAWTYGNPNFVGIPIWLPILWGIASVFIVRAYVFFGR